MNMPHPRPPWAFVSGAVLLIAIAVTAKNFLPPPALGADTRDSGKVWFAPDNETPDLLDLFRHPELWPAARARVNVLKLSAQQLSSGKPFKSNNFDDLVGAHMFATLAQWHMALAAEMGAVKEWDCTGQQAAKQTVDMLKNVAAAGGAVEEIAMDEPIVSGTGPCKLSLTETAARTVAYVRVVQAAHIRDGRGVPVAIGDIEPYPSFSVQTLKDWIAALATLDLKPAFFHLDVNIHYVDLHPEVRLDQDLGDLYAFMRASRIPFGVIFWSGYDPLNSDKLYYDHAMRFVERVHRIIGAPDQMIFQSWIVRSPISCPAAIHACALADCTPTDPAYCGQKSVPLNLPENDVDKFTHTRLIRDGLTALEAPARQ